MLSGKSLIKGFEGVPLILGAVREKRKYDKDGNATDIVEAVRLTALTQEMGSIAIDLFPFSEEKLERCKKNFGVQFTVSDLIGVENCRIFCYDKDVRVSITAADLQLQHDPWNEVNAL